MSRPELGDPVWKALGGLADSQIVRDTRAYAAALAAERQRRSAARRRFIKHGMGWLSGATAVAASVVFLAPAPPKPERFVTAVGEIKTVRLTDGSRVMLNTHTELSVTMTDDIRAIKLVSGQARFDVAHDRLRPFVVSAGPLSVTAVGTAFDVMAMPKRSTVTLIQGRVSVGAQRQDFGKLHADLEPGEQVLVSDHGASKRRVPLMRVLAWQRRQIDLTNLTLDEALAEVNRYSKVRIVVLDPPPAPARVSGIFRMGQPEAVAAAFQLYFGLKLIRRTDREIILGIKEQPGKGRADEPV